jgi:hypothetical protein
MKITADLANTTNEAGFLAAQGWGDAERTVLAGDASARRYDRLCDPDGATAILMMAPMETAADKAAFDAFARVAAHLLAQGWSAPRITAQNRETGLLMMEDFGDLSLSALLRGAAPDARMAYDVAAALTCDMAQAPVPDWAAVPDARGQAGMAALTFDLLPDSADLRGVILPALHAALTRHAAGPPALALRDYHADNLFWLPDRIGAARIGLLDFQDAVALPQGYDLASLLDDPRRVVPASWRDALIAQTAKRMGWPLAAAQSRIDTLSLLRNLRILGIFRRLATAGGKPAYRAFLPRTADLIRRAVANPDLAPLAGPVEDLLARCDAWAGAATA